SGALPESVPFKSPAEISKSAFCTSSKEISALPAPISTVANWAVPEISKSPAPTCTSRFLKEPTALKSPAARSNEASRLPSFIDSGKVSTAAFSKLPQPKKHQLPQPLGESTTRLLPSRISFQSWDFVLSTSK